MKKMPFNLPLPAPPGHMPTFTGLALWRASAKAGFHAQDARVFKTGRSKQALGSIFLSAAVRNRSETIQFLLDRGMDVNFHDPRDEVSWPTKGDTALDLALRSNNFGVADLLMSTGQAYARNAILPACRTGNLTWLCRVWQQPDSQRFLASSKGALSSSRMSLTPEDVCSQRFFEAALTEAAASDNPEIMTFLYENVPDQMNACQISPGVLRLAISRNNIAVLRRYLELAIGHRYIGSDEKRIAQRSDAKGALDTALTHAAGFPHRLPIVELLFDYDATLQNGSIAKDNTFAQAAGSGLIDTAIFLRSKGAKVTDHDNLALRHACIQHASTQMIELLLEWGADSRVVPPYAIGSMCVNRESGSLRALMRQGRGLSLRPEMMGGSLMEGVTSRHTGIVQLLLQYGVSAQGTPNRSPLLVACQNGDLDMVQLLLNHGLDPNIHGSHALASVSPSGATPHAGIAALLRSRGALDS